MSIKEIGKESEMLTARFGRHEWSQIVIALQSAAATSDQNGHYSQGSTFRALWIIIQKRLNDSKGDSEPFTFDLLQ